MHVQKNGLLTLSKASFSQNPRFKKEKECAAHAGLVIERLHGWTVDISKDLNDMNYLQDMLTQVITTAAK